MLKSRDTSICTEYVFVKTQQFKMNRITAKQFIILKTTQTFITNFHSPTYNIGMLHNQVHHLYHTDNQLFGHNVDFHECTVHFHNETYLWHSLDYLQIQYLHHIAVYIHLLFFLLLFMEYVLL